jgi:hypothetical protein
MMWRPWSPPRSLGALGLEAVQQGVKYAAQVVFVSDGAPWTSRSAADDFPIADCCSCSITSPAGRWPLGGGASREPGTSRCQQAPMPKGPRKARSRPILSARKRLQGSPRPLQQDSGLFLSAPPARVAQTTAITPRPVPTIKVALYAANRPAASVG